MVAKPIPSIPERVRAKLHPTKMRVSGQFTAILCYLTGSPEPWTQPPIGGLCITSDQHLLAQDAGDVGYNRFLGSARDLDENLDGVAAAAELTKREREWLLAQKQVRIHYV